MNKIKLAMVGTGRMLDLIGADLHLVEDLIPQVVVSRSAEKAALAATKFNFVDSSGDFEATLKRDDIDLIYIATPHSEHFELAMKALEAGKPILVEKAMTTSSLQTEKLLTYAKTKNLFAMEAMWTAFNPAIVETKKIVTSGVLGGELRLLANFCMAPEYRPESRLWAKRLAGGSTWDQGVYTISLAQMLFGQPISITAKGIVRHDVDAEVLTTLEFANGNRAICLTSLLAFGSNDAVIFGNRGTIHIDPMFWGTKGFSKIIRSGSQIEAIDRFEYKKEGAGYVPMLREVCEAIKAGKTEHPLRLHSETISVAKTMDAVLNQVLN